MTEVADTTTVGEKPSAPPGLLARIIGVLVSPKETFAAVAANPRWLGVMAVTLLIGAVCQYVIFSSPAMQDELFKQATRNPNMTDQQVAAVETFLMRLPALFAGAAFILGPLVTALFSGILMLIFSTLMGGSARFKQVYALVAHSGVVSSVQGILGAALTLSGAPPSGTSAPGANLAIFVPMLEETGFVTRFLGAIDLILVWWIITMSIGLAVLYRRKTGGIAITLLAIYLVIALIVGYVRSGS
jgi:Yip1-like protein